MLITDLPHQEQLIAITLNTPWMMQALTCVRELNLPSWCIGAGAVRNMVWDALYQLEQPSKLADIDVAYFDPWCLSPERDSQLQAQLTKKLPEVPWEVTN